MKIRSMRSPMPLVGWLVHPSIRSRMTGHSGRKMMEHTRSMSEDGYPPPPGYRCEGIEKDAFGSSLYKLV
jgi:hypothetical protein